MCLLIVEIGCQNYCMCYLAGIEAKLPIICRSILNIKKIVLFEMLVMLLLRNIFIDEKVMQHEVAW